jgi:hypothetical protein
MSSPAEHPLGSSLSGTLVTHRPSRWRQPPHSCEWQRAVCPAGAKGVDAGWPGQGGARHALAGVPLGGRGPLPGHAGQQGAQGGPPALPICEPAHLHLLICELETPGVLDVFILYAACAWQCMGVSEALQALIRPAANRDACYASRERALTPPSRPWRACICRCRSRLRLSLLPSSRHRNRSHAISGSYR